jgi:hypothetical protein
MRLVRAVLILGPLIAPGCESKSPPPPVFFDPGSGTLAGHPEAIVEISVEPQSGDPRFVDVWVKAPVAEFWRSVAEDPGDIRWEGLVVVRPERAGDAAHGERSEEGDAALAGTYAVVDERVRFRLAEPLRSGGAYRIEFHRSLLQRADDPGSPELMPVVGWHYVFDR